MGFENALLKTANCLRCEKVKTNSIFDIFFNPIKSAWREGSKSRALKRIKQNFIWIGRCKKAWKTFWMTDDDILSYPDTMGQSLIEIYFYGFFVCIQLQAMWNFFILIRFKFYVMNGFQKYLWYDLWQKFHIFFH